jgi:hypothetical protein
MTIARYALAAVTTSIACAGLSPLYADDITIADLQGITVQTSTRHAGTMRNAKGEAPARIDVRTEVKIGPGSTISSNSTRYVEADTPRGVKTGQLHRSHNGEIGVPKKASDGTGDIVWIVQGNSLIRLRTLESGGHLFKVEFAKSAGGLTCKVDAPFAREVGGGLVKDQGALGSKIEILNIRQTGSSCKVTRGS